MKRTVKNLALRSVTRERMPHRHGVPPVILALGLLLVATVFGSTAAAQEFKGKIGRTPEESVEAFPERVKAPAGAPNILIILWDDAGFAHWSSYGGSIPTPNVDRLAAGGLRYTSMHNTAICAASRASLLTGRNPHSVGFAAHLQTAAGFPGYNNTLPKSKAALPRILQQQGYATYCVGKFDCTPLWEITSTGPFDNWPSGWGFDRFYGTVNAEFDNFRTPMVADHTPIEPWKEKKDWTFAEDITDQTIEMITKHKSMDTRPFFVYFTPSAPHSPHQAPEKNIAKFKGKFDKGWDALREEYLARQKKLGLVPENTKLTDRPEDFPAWDSLPEERRKLYAKQMEVDAGMVDQLDEQIGRILDTLERIGELDNTLIIVTSDNGAAAEGGTEGAWNLGYYYNPPDGRPAPFEMNNKYLEKWGGPETYPQYHAAWANMNVTPFYGWKMSMREGGTRAPFIVHWPKGLKAKGELRSQYAHFDDIAPTLLELTGVKFLDEVDGVKQAPFEGVSFADTLNDPKAPTKKKVQYYELFGHRALWKDGWKIVTRHGGIMPWDINNPHVPFDNDKWELYHLDEDTSESNDLADKMPEKVAELAKLWEEEAVKHNVFPVDDGKGTRIVRTLNRIAKGRTEFTYYAPGAYGIQESLAPQVKDVSHTIQTTLDLKGDEEGVIACMGGLGGGWSLFIKDHQAHYVYNSLGMKEFVVKSGPLPKGKTDILLTYEKKDNHQGQVDLLINGKKVDHAEFGPVAYLFFSMDETFDVGRDTGTTVSALYRDRDQGVFPFKGKLDKVVIKLGAK